MNLPVPPFAKGGLGGIGFLPQLQFWHSIPPAPLGNRLSLHPIPEITMLCG